MLHMLGGGSEHSASEYYGRKIVAAEMRKADGISRWDANGRDSLRLTFEGGQQIAISDDGQSCCESRYMTTDDDLAKIIGGTLTRIETKDGGETGDRMECDVHEIVFVEIGTNECFVTVATHNEHNGYYGGCGLTIDEVTPDLSETEAK